MSMQGDLGNIVFVTDKYCIVFDVMSNDAINHINSHWKMKLFLFKYCFGRIIKIEFSTIIKLYWGFNIVTRNMSERAQMCLCVFMCAHMCMYIWSMYMCMYMQPFHGPEASCPDTTRRRQKPGTRISDTWLISETNVSQQNSMSYWDEVTVRSLRIPARPGTLLQRILQTSGTGRRWPGFVSTSRNRSLRQA